jgi:hypothetical protein
MFEIQNLLFSIDLFVVKCATPRLLFSLWSYLLIILILTIDAVMTQHIFIILLICSYCKKIEKVKVVDMQGFSMKCRQ